MHATVGMAESLRYINRGVGVEVDNSMLLLMMIASSHPFATNLYNFTFWIVIHGIKFYLSKIKQNKMKEEAHEILCIESFHMIWNGEINIVSVSVSCKTKIYWSGSAAAFGISIILNIRPCLLHCHSAHWIYVCSLYIRCRPSIHQLIHPCISERPSNKFICSLWNDFVGGDEDDVNDAL